jgi:hypothetical protein
MDGAGDRRVTDRARSGPLGVGPIEESLRAGEPCACARRSGSPQATDNLIAPIRRPSSTNLGGGSFTVS